MLYVYCSESACVFYFKYAQLLHSLVDVLPSFKDLFKLPAQLGVFNFDGFILLLELFVLSYHIYHFPFIYWHKQIFFINGVSKLVLDRVGCFRVEDEFSEGLFILVILLIVVL